MGGEVGLGGGFGGHVEVVVVVVVLNWGLCRAKPASLRLQGN